jgi:hypothetical protein
MPFVPSISIRRQAAPLLSTAAIALTAAQSFAGSYAPAAGTNGSTAVYKTDAAFVEWASQVIDYSVGTDVEDEWKDTSLCLGKPGNDVYHITCLGNGGTITLGFEKPIGNGDGWDFAVFENGFGAGFLELAYVEVSSDGVNFVRFPSHSETPSKVGAYTTTMDTTCIDGLAGKYELGYGTPFDLSDLKAVSGVEKVNLNRITQIRLVDIIGDGSSKDSDGRPIYDPYPTIGSGGFDLDAIGVRHLAGSTNSGETGLTRDVTLVLTDLSVEVSDDYVKIMWPGENGVNYKVEQSTDLRNWTTVESGIKGSNAALILTIEAPSVTTFYSVVEE